MLTAARPTLQSLQELTALVRSADGFAPLLAALQAGRSATIDGAWGSSGALAIAALAQGASHSVLIALAHPRDADGWIEDIATFSGVRPVLFPAWNYLPTENTVADEVSGQRLRVLKQMQESEPPRFVVATFQALMQLVPARQELERQQRRLTTGEVSPPDDLAGWLVDQGFRRTEVVEMAGEFSRRGGIFDIFSFDAESPIRLEFFGDDIESIRPFDPVSQRSLGTYQTVDLQGLSKPANGAILATGHFTDYLLAGSWTVLVEPEELQDQGRHYLERVPDPRGLFSIPGTFQQLLRHPSVYLSTLPGASMEATCHLRVESVERFSGQVAKLRSELDGIAGNDQIVIACHNEAERKRLGDVLTAPAEAPNSKPTPTMLVGQVRAGFRLVEAGIVVLSDNELFHREEVRRVQPRRKVESRAIDSFLDLSEGDLVVHVGHGIARYRGMHMLEKNGRTEEHLTLEFNGGILLYVPASKIDLVQKYVGGTKTEPELSKLGGTSWQKKKDKVAAATLDLACDMVELQALREAQPGVAYPPDSDWQRQFEAAFPYQETPDQLTTLTELKRDMQKAQSMDRLICGDVGYGKTELAIRAAFKTIDNGRQVAVLVPTTVLAEQHFRTFSQRLAEYPFNVDVISRFRTAGEQKRIIQRLGVGGVDVIIGTHRLVSPDVKFKDLGLVIIDEEQRFGVEHKERLKRLRQTVDVLTMTATPIPRTLHLALLGIRDISNLQTPPPDRLAIETRIARFDPTLIRHAILRELNREGQIYFVHNRVYNIREIANQLQKIVPEARISIVHGQMNEHELEEAMTKFVRKESDILVATTIIESGLDIPNANTIFINQADQYGLADLHQLRGRVGRYKHRAYAYMLIDSERSVTNVASRRLKAIEEFTELGSGFKIALRDLEIRGAGNILGTQQSGHIAAVGYELYCQLLENAVRNLKNQPVRTPLEVTIDLPWPAFFPRTYVDGQRQRIEVYRRLARVRKPDRLEDFRQELRDRFGALPEQAEWMLRLAELRILASRWQVSHIRLETQGVRIEEPPPKIENRGSKSDRTLKKLRPLTPVAPPARIVDLVLAYRNPRKIKRLAERSNGRLRVVDDQSAYFRLSAAETDPAPLFARIKDLLRLPERPV